MLQHEDAARPGQCDTCSAQLQLGPSASLLQAPHEGKEEKVLVFCMVSSGWVNTT